MNGVSASTALVPKVTSNLPRLERAWKGWAAWSIAKLLDATGSARVAAGLSLDGNAFHHLPPAAARKCLADAVRQGRGIAVVEMVDRSATSLFGVTFAHERSSR